MKKIVALLLALVMLLSLAACGAKEEAPKAEAPAAEAPAAEAPAATEAPAPAPAADPVVLRFAFSEAETSQTATIMKTVAANVLERTEGRVVIDCN